MAPLRVLRWLHASQYFFPPVGLFEHPMFLQIPSFSSRSAYF